MMAADRTDRLEVAFPLGLGLCRNVPQPHGRLREAPEAVGPAVLEADQVRVGLPTLGAAFVLDDGHMSPPVELASYPTFRAIVKSHDREMVR